MREFPLFNSALIELNRLKPKVAICIRELNAKLDASGRYTKKIIGVFILLIILLYEYSGRKMEEKPNEFSRDSHVHFCNSIATILKSFL